MLGLAWAWGACAVTSSGVWVLALAGPAAVAYQPTWSAGPADLGNVNLGIVRLSDCEFLLNPSISETDKDRHQLLPVASLERPKRLFSSGRGK